MIEHEGHVERGIAEVRDLEIDHPQPFADEHVLRREVPVDDADARRRPFAARTPSTALRKLEAGVGRLVR